MTVRMASWRDEVRGRLRDGVLVGERRLEAKARRTGDGHQDGETTRTRRPVSRYQHTGLVFWLSLAREPMTRSICATALIAVCLSITGSAAGRATVAPPPCKQLADFGCATQFGFNTYTSRRTITEQRSLGATVSRLFVDWAVVQPSPGQWNWRQTDSEYAAMVAAGLHPLIVAFTAPCWARPSTDCLNPYFTGPPDPAYDQDWRQFVSRLTARYPRAIGIEVWNEPNLDQYFLPHANPDRFAQLLHEAYTAVKAVNPNMPVVSGGLLLSPPVPGAGPVPGGYGADQFLAAMYAAGARQWMNVLGVHLYPSTYVDGVPARWAAGAMQTWLGQLNPVRARYGAVRQPIWITEMGIATATEPGWPSAATRAQQASDLARMVAVASANPAVQVAIVHTLEDEAVGYYDPDSEINAGWGVFTAAGQPTPAACALSRAWHGSLAC
jgi:polysaccharide biosynthesis protein PslG